MTRSAITLLVAVAAALLAGCGNDRGAELAPQPRHVHALAQSPSDKTLYIATHTGMYRLGAGDTAAQRIGDKNQDTMGFAIASPQRFIGSGHPDLRDDLPPLLGLVESRDEGRNWRPVSLLGEADFHLLRMAGTRIYGYDATNSRLLVSNDDGTTWVTQTTPGQLVDLVVDPSNPDIVIAATEASLHTSRDGGRSWAATTGSPVGLMAWPTPNALLLVDGRGRVLRSGDKARTWTEIGTTGAAPSALTAANVKDLYLALHDGPLLSSTDGGSTWTTRLALSAATN